MPAIKTILMQILGFKSERNISMDKKQYTHPKIICMQNAVALIPLAAVAAAVAGPVATVASSVAAVGVPLAAGYAVGRGVKSAMEFRQDEPRIPTLKRICY